MPSTTWRRSRMASASANQSKTACVTGRDVAGSKAGGCGYDARDVRRRRIGQRSLDLAGQRIVVGRRLIGPFNDRHRRRGAQRRQGFGGKWSEGGDGDGDQTPLPAQVIDHGRGRVRDRPHADHDELGIQVRYGSMRPYRPCQRLPFGHRLPEHRSGRIEGALSDPSLHVRVLVLHNAGHQR